MTTAVPRSAVACSEFFSLAVTELDEEVGATKSADLLASDSQTRRLVEVKAASCAALERIVSHLDRHLGSWP
jgi:hypothetical protein